MYKNKKKTTGINKDGNIFTVLQSLIFRMFKPAATISAPPTISSSVFKFSLMADEEIYAIR